MRALAAGLAALAAQHVTVPSRPGRWSFAWHGATHLGQVGTVLRTAGHAADVMLDMAGPELGAARLALELGAGDGPVTGPLLARLPREARLVACEINPGLAASARIRAGSDPRAEVVCRPALEMLREYQGKADVVVSTLPLRAFRPRARSIMVAEAMGALTPGGVFLQLQYTGACRDVLGLWAVDVREVRLRRGLPWAWLVPLRLYACR